MRTAPLVPVHLVPLQAQKLPPAAAGDQQQVHGGPPLQGLAGQGLEDLAHLLGLVIVGGAGLLFGRGGPAGRVEGDEHLPLGLGQDARHQGVAVHNGAAAQALFLPDGVEQGRFGQVQGLGDALGGGGAHGLALAQPGQADPAAVRAGDTGGEPPGGPPPSTGGGWGRAVSLSTRASGWARDS